MSIQIEVKTCVLGFDIRYVVADQEDTMVFLGNSGYGTYLSPEELGELVSQLELAYHRVTAGE